MTSSPARPPQRRVLVRARNLATFRAALCHLAVAGSVSATRRRVVLIPTHAAAELLRQAIESTLLPRTESLSPDRPMPGGAAALPDFVTRETWLRRLLDGGCPGRRLLTRLEREVLLERAAHQVALRRRLRPPFQLRPGLIATILDFYDELQRRERTTRRFARAIFDELRGERGTDRGSETLVEQTRFLGFTFLAYERLVAASGALDEHLLRRQLLRTPVHDAGFDELIVAVADHPADPTGLWPADFDLAGRLAAVGTLQVVITDEAHDAGFRDRLERQLPGIEEQRWPDAPRNPHLIAGPSAEGSPIVHVSRDREEELRDIARHIRASGDGERLPGRIGIVFHRPLPYLYLSRQVLTDARIPFQAFDALPLAAEPYAALLDLVLTLAVTGGTRDASLELLRSRLLQVHVEGRPVTLDDAAALEEVLVERRATGDAASFVQEVEAAHGSSGKRLDVPGAMRAARALCALTTALEPFRTAPAASTQLRTLEHFLRRHERLVSEPGEPGDRYRRARAAVLAVLVDLASACERHDDRGRPPEEIAALVHHAIEQRTFTPREGRAGLHLVDRSAARFGEFDRTYLVGLVESEWSDRPRRNVLYSAGLLDALGWPQDNDQALAQRAAFADMLTLPRVDSRLSAFELEGDAIVGLSPLIELARSRPALPEEPSVRQLLFPDERLTAATSAPGLDANTEAWWRWRHERPPLTDRVYSGFVTARPPGVYRVSRVDRYVACPFKYFAEDVLKLAEDRRVSPGLTPLERGTLLHSLFERFYETWQAHGHGAIEWHTLDHALDLFGTLTREALSSLPEADRIVEEARLLGSLVTRGVAERVFELEIASRERVSRRMLEVELEGEFSFPVRLGLERRSIAIRGKADRIDVLGDGSLRVIDYKLGRMPDVDRSVQVAVYAYCASQQLERTDGRPHPVSSAAYLAFGDDRRLEGRINRASEPGSLVAEARALVFATTVEQIEAGAFPPQPQSAAECQWCGYAGVCRKEYRTEQDEAADAV